jgi:type II secretory pathway pseudopilin PulG
VKRRNGQHGYAFLTVIFLAAVMAIGAAVIVPRAVQEGRREKELETIWRGKQYARGVKLFYRKFGRFPTSIDELTKPVNNVRVMRQSYKDPFNREDGSWRLIYVGPLGQLIGSVKPAPQGQIGPMIGLPGTTPGGQGVTPGTAQPPGQPLAPGAIGAPGAPASTPGNAPLFTNPQAGGAQGTPTASGGPIVGGNIIGVGSKVAMPSVIIYDGGATYREWEFIWNPAKDPIVLGGGTIGTPPGARPIGAPAGGTMQPPPQPPPVKQPN